MALQVLGCGGGPEAVRDVQSPDVVPGRVVLHRLNRQEYDNTVRDLLGTSLRPAMAFPADGRAAGFDNIASNLSLSALHLEMYEAAAEHLAEEALGMSTEPPVLLRFEAETELQATAGEAFEHGWTVPSAGALSTEIEVPADGTYELSTRVWRGAGSGLALLTLSVDDDEVLVDGVTATSEPEAEVFALALPLQAGAHSVGLSYVSGQAGQRDLQVDWLQIYGPVGEIGGPNDLVTCDPVALGAPACAREVLADLAFRAFRRPVDDEALERLLAVPTAVLEGGGSFDQAMKFSVMAVLTSPRFLFRVETVQDRFSSEPEALDDWEIASRLSYFLWSTMPDDALFEAARAGQLSSREGIAVQVRRMLADPRAEALVDSFGGQWLYLRGIDEMVKDPAVFPDFDEALRASMKEEMVRFFRSFVAGRRDLHELLTATHGEIDGRLAQHYGVDGSVTDGFESMDLSALERGGLLGQAGWLSMVSHPGRTSVVQRGKFVLGQLLCDEPEAPPDGVTELSPSDGLTAREQLARHRADPACAVCHATMDEIGFALEQFDAVGAWRVQQAGVPIDAWGELPDGRRFTGVRGTAEVVAADPRFGRCVAQQLFTYALGRVPVPSDDPALQIATTQFEASGWTFEGLAVAIATSDAFRMTQGEP